MLTTTRQLIGRNLSENSCSLTWILTTVTVRETVEGLQITDL